jgi:hypothetical protein
MKVVQVAVVGHTGRRILERAMRKVSRPTRAICPRQLPTNHDYAARPANIWVINRRDRFLDRNLYRLPRSKE